LASFPALRQAAAVRVAAPRWHAVELCERAAAVLLLAASAPLWIPCAVALAAFSGRSPLIAHRRVGWRGETLWMMKLRTMWGRGRDESRAWVEYVADEAGPEQKQAADPRVGNRFAHFCRRHSIDEVPQLWHVIRGEMSLVGPRPVTASEVREHYGDDAGEILQVKPGLAGLWQISGRNRLTWPERRALDLQFVRQRSLGMYTRILLRTLPEVWRGGNSW
jgi:exopolysaccharide production protein ExoY